MASRPGRSSGRAAGPVGAGVAEWRALEGFRWAHDGGVNQPAQLPLLAPVERRVNLAALCVHGGQHICGLRRVLGHGVETADAHKRPVQQRRQRLRARDTDAQPCERSRPRADGDQADVAPFVPSAPRRRGPPAARAAALAPSRAPGIPRARNTSSRTAGRGTDRPAALDCQDVHRPCQEPSDSATWIARRTPRALLSVSSYSRSGTESATIPAPAWTMASPSCRISVRMAMQVSRFPRKST